MLLCLIKFKQIKNLFTRLFKHTFFRRFDTVLFNGHCVYAQKHSWQGISMQGTDVSVHVRIVKSFERSAIIRSCSETTLNRNHRHPQIVSIFFCCSSIYRCWLYDDQQLASCTILFIVKTNTLMWPFILWIDSCWLRWCFVERKALFGR